MEWEKEKTWVAVDGHGDERIFNEKPRRSFPNLDLEVLWGQRWEVSSICGGNYGVRLPKGTIKKLIGKELTFSDDPVCL